MAKFKVKQCHTGNVEIYPYLFVGGSSRMADATNMVHLSLDGVCLGQYGENFYHLDIDDFGVPDWSMNDWASVAMFVRDTIEEGTPVLVSCMGGHGRTGMVAAVVLAALGVKNQVDYIRDNYCHNAIETKAQEVMAIAVGDYLRQHIDEMTFTGLPVAKDNWATIGEDKDWLTVDAAWVDDCPMCGSPMFSYQCDTCGFSYTAWDALDLKGGYNGK